MGVPARSHTHPGRAACRQSEDEKISLSIQLLIPGMCAIYSITHCPCLYDSVLVFSPSPCPMANNKAELQKSVLPALVRITTKMENIYSVLGKGGGGGVTLGMNGILSPAVS